MKKTVDTLLITALIASMFGTTALAYSTRKMGNGTARRQAVQKITKERAVLALNVHSTKISTLLLYP
ncbi:MAG: hypothetical protein FWG10_01125 [Eubacteriaceae bacterium]|nr:hypothetical protein [Eubacteriaceae bacterium]